LPGEGIEGALLIGLPAAGHRDPDGEDTDEHVHEAVPDETHPAEHLHRAGRGLALTAPGQVPLDPLRSPLRRVARRRLDGARVAGRGPGAPGPAGGHVPPQVTAGCGS